MISLGAATRVYLAIGATDMRKGFNGLFALARDRIGIDPLSGHLFVFCNRQCNRIKALYFDGSGLWVCAKRLERGRFSWPQAASGDDPGTARLSREELALLLGGLQMENVGRKRWWRAED